MTNRTMQFGIRFTADGKVAVAEGQQVERTFEGINRSAKAAEASARSAYDALGMRRPMPIAGQVKEVEQASKQAAFAMRMLPAQMTDIAVGLSSGQSPFMVLMQQGGQLKDMFGGIGPAFRAVGGYIAGLVNPFTIAAAAAAALGYALVSRFADGRDAVEEFASVSKEADEAFGSLNATFKSVDFTSLYKAFNEADAVTRKLIQSQVELRLEILKTTSEAARGSLSESLASIGHESSWFPGSDAIQSKLLEQVDTLKIAGQQRVEFVNTMMALNAQTISVEDAFKKLREIVPLTTKDGREFVTALSKAVDAELRLKDATEKSAEALEKMRSAGGGRKIAIDADRLKSAKVDIDELSVLLNKIHAADFGIDDDYQKNLAMLSAGMASGRLNAVQYAEALFMLTSRQKFYTDAVKKSAAEVEEGRKREIARNDAQWKAVEGYDAEIRKLREHNEEIGLSAAQLDALRLARMDEAIALKENARAVEIATNGYTHHEEILRTQIEQMKELRELTGKGQSLERANRDAVDMWQSIERAAHDTWTAVNRDGEDAFKSLGRTLKSAVLDVLYQMTVKRWIVQIAAAVSGEGVAEKAVGSSGIADGIGGWLSKLAADFAGWLFPNAQGGVYAGAGIGAYRNTVVDRPTVFPFAHGIGLMGEKPGSPGEAIMPLTRMPDGDLGVKVMGGGGGLGDVRIEMINQGQTSMRVTDSRVAFDAEGMVVRMFLSDMRDNGPMRQAIAGALGGRG